MPEAPAAPTPVDPGQSAIDFTRAMADPALQQLLLSNEQLYRPQYTQLELNDINQLLTGGEGVQSQFDPTGYFNSLDQSSKDAIAAEAESQGKTVQEWLPGHIQAQAQAGDPWSINALKNFSDTQTGGLLGLYGEAIPYMANLEAQATSSQRAADVQDVQKMAGAAGQAFRDANPQLQAALNQATGMGGQSNYYGGLQDALANQKQFGDVNAGMVGGGALGDRLMQQALGAGGLGQVGQTLQDRAQGFAQSTGELNADELRNLQQSVRSAYSARGTLDSGQAVSAEALGRLTNQRERMLQDVSLASMLNQASQAELGANRQFQMGVQGQDLGRQFQNVGNQFMADSANRQFGATQQQQNIQNQGTLGQLLQGQGAQDRSYALSLAGAQQSAASDPFMAILGRQGQAFGSGQGAAQFTSGLAGQALGPNLFDPNAGINLALQNQSNLANYNANIYGSQAALAGAQAQAGGSMLGGIFGGIGTALGGPLGGAIGGGLGSIFGGG